MNRTQTRIAKILRKQIGAHYTLICSTPQHQLKDADYWAARSESDQATQQERYLAQHLVQLDSVEFLQACGIRA